MLLFRCIHFFFFFFFNDTATTEIYTLSLHDALPISAGSAVCAPAAASAGTASCRVVSAAGPASPGGTSTAAADCMLVSLAALPSIGRGGGDVSPGCGTTSSAGSGSSSASRGSPSTEPALMSISSENPGNDGSETMSPT